MRAVALAPGCDRDGFRRAIGALLAAQAPPRDVLWRCAAHEDLFASEVAAPAQPVSLPRRAVELIDLVLMHRDPARHALLYEVVWRLLHGERALLQMHHDPLMHRLSLLEKAVRRDLHKMHAFVRFRLDERRGEARYIAWFEPDHFILDAAAPFFINRFRAMKWSILTPIGALHWDGATLTKGPPALRADAPEQDAFEAGWRAYYESTFNPARTNIPLMVKEMPKRYWRNLPEAQSIQRLIDEAPDRLAAMVAQTPAPARKRDPVKAVERMSDQAPASLDALNALIAAAPPPPGFAPRAVLGEGPIGAPLALVGEQPGDQEESAGRPFIGPAGQVLMRALAAAGLAREDIYLTNAVKHFKFEQRGKRRLHKTPTQSEVKHYRWWLDLELDFARPRLVVALGATAALAMVGKPLSVGAHRGPIRFGAREGFITTHPSALLRLPDETARAAGFAAFVLDLKDAARRAAA